MLNCVFSDHPELMPRSRGQTLGDAGAIQRFLQQQNGHRGPAESADRRQTSISFEQGSAGLSSRGGGESEEVSVIGGKRPAGRVEEEVTRKKAK